MPIIGYGLVTTAVILLTFIIFVWRQRAIPGAKAISLFLLNSAFWLIAYAVETAVPDFQSKYFWFRLQYISTILTPTIWFVFILQYTRQVGWLGHPLRWLLLVEPIIQLLLLLTDGSHALLWENITFDATYNAVPVLLFTRRVGSALHVAYLYALQLIGAALLFRAIIHHATIVPRQLGYVLLVSLTPWLLSIFAFLIVPAQIRPAPFAAALIALGLTFIFLRLQQVDILPAARAKIVESMSDAMLVIDAQNRLVDFNQAAEAVIAFPIKERLQQPIVDLFPEQTKAVAQFLDVLETHTELAVDVRGQRRTFDVQISPILDSNGRLQGRTIIWRDISQHKQTEERLRQRNLILQTLNEISMAVARTLDISDILQTVAILTAQTLDADCVTISDWHENEGTTTPLVRHFRQPANEKAADTYTTYQLQRDFGDDAYWLQDYKGYHIAQRDDPNLHPLKRAYFQKFGVLSAITVPLWEMGKAIGFIEAWAMRQRRDFSPEDVELLQAIARQVVLNIRNGELHHSLQSSLQRTEALYNAAQSLISSYDLPTLLQTVAHQVATALTADRLAIIVLNQADKSVAYFIKGGKGADQIVQLSYEELMAGLTGYVLNTLEPVLSPKGKDDPRESEIVRLRQQETNCGSIMVVPLRHREQLMGTMTTINRPEDPDFTPDDLDLMVAMASQTAIAIANTQLYEAVRERARLLADQNKELDAYAHTVAHDLKSPLTVVIGYAEYLEELLYNEGIEKFGKSLEKIKQQGHKMNTIIDELLFLATMRKTEVEIRPLDMSHIVQEAISRLQPEIAAANCQLKTADHWPVALGYAPWVEEIWANYISNALKYGGLPPHIQLDATIESDNKQVRFWVRDNGPGIPPEQLERLFTPFERLEQTRAKGHGLGLSIVRRIIGKMDGDVNVESTPGEGSTFSFTLPLADNGS
jgi:PAS domain S-box-containing protein